MLFSKFLDKLKKRIFLRLASKGTRLDLDGNRYDGFPAFLILTRDLYRESVKTYPLESRRELEKVLKLRTFNKNEVCFSDIHKITDGGFLVKDYIFDKETLGDDSNLPLFAIPESAIVSDFVANGRIASIKTKDTPYFIYKNGDVARSALAKGNHSEPIRFAASVGAPFDAVSDMQEITLSGVYDGYDVFTSCFKRMSWCFLPFKKERISAWFVKPAVIISAIAVLHIITTSAYLYYLDNKLLNEYDKNRSILVTANRLTSDVNALESRIKSLNRVSSEMNLVSPMWSVIGVFKTERAEINSVTYIEKEIVVQGTHQSASELLATLQGLTEVKTATFDSPVLSRNNQEVFAIRFTLNSNALTGSEIQEGQNG